MSFLLAMMRINLKMSIMMKIMKKADLKALVLHPHLKLLGELALHDTLLPLIKRFLLCTFVFRL